MANTTTLIVWKEHSIYLPVSLLRIPPLLRRRLANESNHSSRYGVFANSKESWGTCTSVFVLFSRHTFFCILIAGRVNEEAIDQIMNAKRFNNTLHTLFIHFTMPAAAAANRKNEFENGQKNGMSSHRRRRSSNRRNPSDDLKSCLLVLWHS